MFGMRATGKTGMSLVIAVVLLLILSPASSATVFTVDTLNYTKSESLSNSSSMDRFELRATSGEAFRYSVTADTTGSCVQLYFSKGHNLGAYFQYLVMYSQDTCVGSFSDAFSVGSSDGTEFTITITTTDDYEMNYTLNIEEMTASLPAWFCPLFVVIILIGIVVIVVIAIRDRKRKAAMQSMQQPLYVPPPPPPQ